MFSLNDRKQNTTYIIEKAEEFLLKNNNNNNNKALTAYYLIIFHWLSTGIPLMYIIFGDVNLFYYLCCLLWIIIFILHFYFAGCICTRIERKLLNDKEWWGPWIFYFTPLELTGIKITANLANNIFICWGICLGVIAFLKILYSIKY